MRLVFLGLVGLLLRYPAICQTNLPSTLQQFREAVRNGQLVEASEIASKLDDEVHQQSQKALIKDAPEHLREVLSWLPSNVDSFFFLQAPFTIMPGPKAARQLLQEPERRYAIDRLIAIDEGRYFDAMKGVSIRMGAAGMSNREPPSEEFDITPAIMPTADVAYFYFLDRPLPTEAFGAPESVDAGHPIWKGIAEILKAHPGSETIPDESWLALARPDLLVLTSKHALLVDILGRISNAGGNRALPESLPEWKFVDKNVSFWGLRHYRNAPEKNPKDPGAIGVTMQLDVTTDKVQTRYFSSAKTLLVEDGNLRPIDFAIYPIAGGWLLESNIRDRGPIPFHIGMKLLGFGTYK